MIEDKQRFIMEIVGYIAAILTTMAYVPQALKTIGSKKTTDIALNMYLFMFIGVSGWLAYGIYLRSIPMLIANSVTLVLITIIIVMKLKYK